MHLASKLICVNEKVDLREMVCQSQWQYRCCSLVGASLWWLPGVHWRTRGRKRAQPPSHQPDLLSQGGGGSPGELCVCVCVCGNISYSLAKYTNLQVAMWPCKFLNPIIFLTLGQLPVVVDLVKLLLCLGVVHHDSIVQCDLIVCKIAFIVRSLVRIPIQTQFCLSEGWDCGRGSVKQLFWVMVRYAEVCWHMQSYCHLGKN